MDVRYKTLEEQIFLLNEDEKFYRDDYEVDSLPVIFNLSYHVWTKKTQYADTS